MAHLIGTRDHRRPPSARSDQEQVARRAPLTVRAILAFLAAILLNACEAGPPEIRPRTPDWEVAAAGGGIGALNSAATGGIPVVGAVFGVAATFVEVRPRVPGQFPGRPSSRHGCPTLAGCVFGED